MDGPLPARFIPRERAYSNVLFDPSTGLIVAGSSLKAKFASYEEDGNRIWEPDCTKHDSYSYPFLTFSSIKYNGSYYGLLDFGAGLTRPLDHIGWVLISLFEHDFYLKLGISYEFATNEFINDMSSVSLETASTESGTKDFIAVGTTIDRGEDLATKGAVSPILSPSVQYIHV